MACGVGWGGNGAEWGEMSTVIQRVCLHIQELGWKVQKSHGLEEAVQRQNTSVMDRSFIKTAPQPENPRLAEWEWGVQPTWTSLTSPWPGKGLTGGMGARTVTSRLMRLNVLLEPGVPGRLDLALLPRPGQHSLWTPDNVNWMHLTHLPHDRSFRVAQ